MPELRKIDLAPKTLTDAIHYDGNIEVFEGIAKLNSLRRFLKDFKALGYDIDHQEHYGNLSSRINGNEFICTASQSSGLSHVEEWVHFPIVTDFRNNKVYWKGVMGTHEPSVEASTHDGFYRGNDRIRYVAHGHFQLIHETYRRSADALTFPCEISYGSHEIRDIAISSGRDKKILMHETPYGNYGIIIPEGHFNAFFLVGESLKTIKLGFLRAVAKSSKILFDRATEEILRLD